MKKTTIALVLALCASLLSAQYSFYYGKNKIVRHAFPWKYVETKNFRIYHYIDDQELLARVAAEAEKAYEKLSTFLNVTIEEKTPIIFYNKQTDLEQTNLYPGIISPGSFEGFTEPVGKRVVIYGNRSSDDLGRLITHELSHSFENAILYKNRPSGMFDFNRPPLWVMEGFAEFMTGYWDSFSLHDRHRQRSQRPHARGAGGRRYPRRLRQQPHALRFRPPHVRILLCQVRQKGDPRPAAQPAPSGVDRQAPQLSGAIQFRAQDLQFRIQEISPATASRPSSAAKTRKTTVSSSAPISRTPIPFPTRFRPAANCWPWSRSISATYKIDIILVSLKDGKVIKNVTPGFKSTYDGIEFKFVPTDGRSFSWDRNGENIAFFVRKELDTYLIMLNAIDNRVLKEFKIGDIQKPSSPVFHPRQNRLLFTGIEGIQSFIYSLDLASGQIRKLTDGRVYVKAVDISADGEKVVYSAGDGNFDKLYLAATENPDLAMKLTEGEYNDIAPAFSLDGKTVYYSSDELGAFNICSLDLENKILYRLSDVRTGNFFPVEIPKEKGTLVISSYHKGSFLLFKKDVNSYLAKRPVEFSPIRAAVLPVVAEAAAPFTLTVKKYKPFEKLLITSLPPVTVAVDTNGGFFGSSYLNVTDMLGDHNFIFYLASFYGYRSYHLAYLNQQRRLQLYAHLFSESDAYYYPYVSTLYLTLRSRIGGDFALIYPFSRSTRAELTVSAYHQTENSDLFFYGYDLPYGQFFNGFALPVEVALTSETTRFANFGPNMGHTFRFSVGKFFKLFSKSLDAYTLEGDFRKYLRLDNYTLLAFRLSGFYSGGKNAMLYWSGGNNTLRAAEFRSLVGNKGFFLNAEFRFALVHAALTPIGVIGPVRGVFFFDMGGLWFNEQKFRIFEPGSLRLQDALSSYGYGIEFFLFGYPFHFEWVWKTDFKEKQYSGVNFWIGFDF